MRPFFSKIPSDYSHPLQPSKIYLLFPSTIILILLSALIAFLRFRTYHEPIPCDITLYSSIAHELLNGRMLYSDLWEQKPPATFITYVFAELLTGYGNASIYLLTLVAATVTLLGIFRAGWMLSGQKSTGLMAALLWALISGDIRLEANQPNVEVFINATTVWMFVFFLNLNGQSNKWQTTFLTGILALIATLYKQYLIITVIFLSFAYLMTATENRRTAVRQMINLFTIIFLGWMLFFVYFSLTGRFRPTWRALFEFTYYYSTSWNGAPSNTILRNILVGFLPLNALPNYASFLIPLFLLSFIATAFNARNGRHWMMFAFLLLATFVNIAVPGKFFAHYYQLWLPPLCIGTSWSFEWLREKIPASLSLFLRILCIGITGGYEYQWFPLSPLACSRVEFGDFYFYQEPIASFINRILLPGETFYEWNGYPMFYHASGRLLSAGTVTGAILFDSPMAPELTQNVLHDLTSRKPELVILDEKNPPWPVPEIVTQHPVSRFIVAHYFPMYSYGPNGRFQFWVRSGGALEKRIRSNKRINVS